MSITDTDCHNCLGEGCSVCGYTGSLDVSQDDYDWLYDTFLGFELDIFDSITDDDIDNEEIYA